MPTDRTAFRIPQEILAAMDAAAKDNGMTRTAWLLRTLRRELVPRGFLPPEPLSRQPTAEPEPVATTQPEVSRQKVPDPAPVATVDPPPGRAARQTVATRPTRSSADDLRARLDEQHRRQASCPHPKVRRTGRFCSVCGGVVVEEPSGDPQ